MLVVFLRTFRNPALSEFEPMLLEACDHHRRGVAHVETCEASWPPSSSSIPSVSGAVRLPFYGIWRLSLDFESLCLTGFPILRIVTGHLQALRWCQLRGRSFREPGGEVISHEPMRCARAESFFVPTQKVTPSGVGASWPLDH